MAGGTDASMAEMKFAELMRDIKGMDVYTPAQWSEYISYFQGEADFEAASTAENDLIRRIIGKKGSSPAVPDYTASSKIASLEMLAGKRKKDEELRSKDAGLPLGIVSGCFDLLHIGHLRGIAYAKEYLNTMSGNRQTTLCALTLSDENIRRKKGDGRPILDIGERLQMICSAKSVDYVIPLSEANCLRALGELRPEYFFNAGSDFSQGIVCQEVALVKSHGGIVVVFPSQENQTPSISTTDIINKVLGQEQKSVKYVNGVN
jgi:D-beta-D-heptose 7-phosphate kinase / D-beta-D-heptose 1-phosphate adenosyltransferase